MSEIRRCDACGGKIEKTSSETVELYQKRNACSRKCASAIRFNKPTIIGVSVAFERLNDAVSGWHPNATKRHELRGTA